MNSAEFTKDFTSDTMDCLSDFFEEQQEAIRETDISDWEFVEQPDDLSP